MADSDTAVFGIYRTSAQAAAAVDRIVESRTTAGGFTQNDISVLLSDTRSAKEFALEKSTREPEGTTGATAGGIVGGALGLLAGFGALAIPGVGSFIAAGPIMAVLAGLGVGGAIGGLIGALVGMGVPEFDAKRYEGRIKKGGVLLSIHCDTTERISRAERLLRETGAEDISSGAEKIASARL